MLRSSPRPWRDVLVGNNPDDMTGTSCSPDHQGGAAGEAMQNNQAQSNV